MGSIEVTPARSLRSRWNRAFAVLFTVFLLGGVGNFVATKATVDPFKSAAHRIEREAALLAQLRADTTATALLQSAAFQRGVVDPGELEARSAADRASFERLIRTLRSGGGREQLQQSFGLWQELSRTIAEFKSLSATEIASMPPEKLAQGAMVFQQMFGLFDQAGGASRASARADLTRAGAVQRTGTAVSIILSLVVIGLMVRFARRLSSEVLRPVGLLRDSANQLAAGELDQRVNLDRADELGDLAASFNAMADAIAGSQRSLTQQAHHDSLTGLANRAAFHTRLASALGRPERREGTQAVLFVDLDDFKDVNDTLGHAAGDELLCVVAERLRDVVRPGDLVARLGGDEFAILLDGIADPSSATSVAERAVAALAASVEISGTWVHVGASVGLAMRHDGSDPESLMREADVAMYSAKGRGKNRVEPYDSTLNAAVVDQHALKADIADAAGRGELRVDYQPIVDLTTGNLLGVEALVRWQHPTRGLLAPYAFIGLAEKSGAIIGIGSWVLETAARQLQSWQRRYDLPELWLSVNVSVCQLDDEAFAQHVEEILSRTGIKPGCLVLEVTESVLADPARGAARTLNALRELGLHVALDDFGTGYSSIGYLQQLPVDILKIDRSFVSGEHANKPGDALLEAIISLAQRLGLDVIPEGIEEPDQLARLQALGCRAGQGFLLSRPMQAAAIEELLAAPGPLLGATAVNLGQTAQHV